MKYRKRFAIPSVACLLILTSIAFSQTSSTSLRGTVTDPSGGVIPKATVVLTNTSSIAERTVVTGVEGEYQFLFLPPGTYTLTVTAAGFARFDQTGLQLLVNTPATANVEMKVGQTSERVTVTTEAPALNMVDASIGNAYGETQVKQIPLEGRNVPDLLTLQAGVAYTGNRTDMNTPGTRYRDEDTRNGAVNGARSDQTNVTLDGVDVNDYNAGYAFTSVLPVTLDSVQEFRVTTANYNADQGEGSGAQVALVTKSGTNNFHGSLYEYNRNTATSANDWLVQAAENRTGQPNKPLKLIRNIFGGSVGGPMKKNRLFFFANYEGNRDREEHSVVRNIPTSSLCLGNIKYINVNGGITTLTPTDIFNLDPWEQPGSINPGQGGVNKAVLSLGRTTQPGYFDSTFCTPTGSRFRNNDPAVGDGLNYEGFRFAAPFSSNNDAFIARVDYHITSDGKHTLFWRGNVQNLFNPQEPFLPGSPPQQTFADHSKGFAVGYTTVLSSSKVNTFHWGFTRESQGFQGNTNQEWNTFYTLDQGINYSHNFQLPVHNLSDDFSWTKGKHTLQFGGNVGFARNPRVSLQHSFAQALGATFWMSPVAFANTAGPGCPAGGSPLDPCYLTNSASCNFQACPEPASTTAYDYPMLALLGMVSVVRANYNYDKNGNVLNYTRDPSGNWSVPTGAPVKRNWGLDWYEFYGEDSWRLKSNLTLNYGLRWSLLPPPWEVNGFQATPQCSAIVNAANGTSCPSGTFDLGRYFNQNVQNMRTGKGYADGPLVSFGLGGPANNAPGLYHFEKSDFSPRVSIAYSPRPKSEWLRKILGEGDKTVIRAGFSRVYDRTGMELLNTFDAVAPAGLSASLVNLCCGPGVDDAGHVPRISNINQIPVFNLNTPPAQFFTSPTLCSSPGCSPPGAFPQTPGAFGESITWGIDQSLKTPYAYMIDFSIGRELPKGFSLQFSYVGRLGRRLLTQRDLTQPLDLVDPKSGIDYFAAATDISKLARNGTPIANVSASSVPSTARFWQDLLMASGSNTPGLACSSPCGWAVPGGTTTDVVRAVYALYVTSGAFAGDEVVGLGNIDLFGLLCDNASTAVSNSACGGTANSYFFNGKTGEMLSQQLTSMYAWSSIGSSHYHALQANLRKQVGHGVQLDLYYTYSKSIDISSGTARLGFSGSDNIGAPGSRLPNALSPNQFRAVSDFDTTHQINADWIVDLPFGKGRRFASNSSGGVDAFIGGWQVSGLARWTTGFPFSVDNGPAWPTDWDEQGSAQLVGNPKTGAFVQPNGTVSVFANPAAALQNDFIHPFPGGSGTRNGLRGQGYAGWDMSLSKRWKIRSEGESVQFRWEVFNVPNLHRFNVQAGLGDQPTRLDQVPAAFGAYTGLMTNPRVMQFALRYEF